jgi:hypothetical protein
MAYFLGCYVRSLSDGGSHYEPAPAIPQDELDRRAAVEAMHVAKMPCPGSCGSYCPNHFCSAHNGTPFVNEWKPKSIWC